MGRVALPPPGCGPEALCDKSLVYRLDRSQIPEYLAHPDLPSRVLLNYLLSMDFCEHAWLSPYLDLHMMVLTSEVGFLGGADSKLAKVVGVLSDRLLDDYADRTISADLRRAIVVACPFIEQVGAPATMYQLMDELTALATWTSSAHPGGVSFIEELEQKLQAKFTGVKSKSFYVEDGIDLKRRAPNAIAWVAGKEFLNQPKIYTHRRQYQVIRDFFQLRCPICNRGTPDCWNKTTEELKAEVLLEFNEARQEDVCGGCGLSRSELEDDGLLRRYDTMVGIAGMRSGKSVCAGFIGTYLRHILTVLGIEGKGALHNIFNILPTQPLELGFVATTNTQSNQTIWANFFNQCKDSPWFKAYVKWVKRRENEQPKIQGVKNWRYNENESLIEDGWAFFNCASLHSNSSSLAGRTRVGFLVDELSRFNTGESKMGADEVWAVFEHSLKTVRGAKLKYKGIPAFLGCAITVTSPISIEDKAMLLYNQGRTLPSWFVWKYPTWLFNPEQPRENFDVDYAADTVMAERDFGANPPNASTPLVEQPLLYAAGIDWTAKPTASFSYYEHVTPTGQQYVAARYEHSIVNQSRPLYIFGDAGVRFDQFALVACSARWIDGLRKYDAADIENDRVQRHLDYLMQRAPGSPEPDPFKELALVTYHEWSLRIIPSQTQSVWFDSVVEIIREISKRRKIAMVGFDHWNSQSTLQQIQQMNIPTQIVSLKAEDHLRLVQDVYTYRCRPLPWLESDGMTLDEFGTLKLTTEGENLSSEAATTYELFRLERSEDLKRVFNPRKGKVRGRDSEDLANCFVGAHRLVQESLGLTRPDRKIEKQSREIAGAARFRGGLARHRWG